MSMKKYLTLGLVFAFAACGSSMASQKDEDMSVQESFPVLSEEALLSEMTKGSESLDKALAIAKKNPKAVIQLDGKYFSWMTQCLNLLEKEKESRLWPACLQFSARVLQVEISGESATMLVPVFKQQRQKWESTLKSLSKSDQKNLQEQVQMGLALSVE